MKTLKDIVNYGAKGYRHEAMVVLEEKPVDEKTIVEVGELNEQELDELMKICCITFFNEMPVEALTKHEKSLAYCIWKANIQNQQLQKLKKYTKKAQRTMAFLNSYLERGFL